MGQEIINTLVSLQRSTEARTGLGTGPLFAPCPFCGEADGIVDHPDWRASEFIITCARCEASAPPGATEVEAIERWNSRVGA